MSELQLAHLAIILVLVVVAVFVVTGLILATVIMVKEVRHQLRRRR